MSFEGHADELDLVERIEALQLRVEHLESLLIVDASTVEPEVAVEPISRVGYATPVPAPETTDTALAPLVIPPLERSTEPQPKDSPPASPEPPDLRKLQATATADVGVVHSQPEADASGGFDLRYIEERVAGRALALVGGAALLLGAVFFLSLAFSRGWIGPDLQVILGLIGGSMGLLVGAVLLVRGDRLVGHVLTAVGLGVISLSFFAATSLYELIDPALALAGVFAAAAVTTVIAIRSSSQIVAGFGLVAVMAAPPLLGAAPEPFTIAYMVAALVGVAAISLWQTWPWLPPIAFVLSLPQLYEWIATEPEATLGVPVLLLYWLLIAVAAGGEAFRSPRRALSISSAPLFLAVGACVIGLGFTIVEPVEQRAALLLVLALMHGLITAFFAQRRGSLDPFGLLAGAYGIAIASAAVPLLFGATMTSIIWAAEAATLAFFAGRRGHGPSLIAAAVLYGIAAAQIALEALRHSSIVRYAELGATASSDETVVVGFLFLVAIGAAIMAFVPVRSVRLLVVGTVGAVAIPVAYLVLDEVVLIAAWVAVAIVAAGSPRWLRILPERRIRWWLGPALRWLRPTTDTAPVTELLPMGVTVFAMALATVLTASWVVALEGPASAIPFSGQAGLSAIILAAGYVAVGVVSGAPAGVRLGLLAAGLTIGLVSIVELPAPWYVLVWAALAAAAAWASRIDDRGTIKYWHMAVGALAVLVAFAIIEAPPGRLLVDRVSVAPHAFLVSGATLALGALAVAAAVVAYAHTVRPRRLEPALWALSGAAVLYLLSVAVVDVFSGEAYGLSRLSPRFDELAKEAQVALSVLWTVAGVAVLGIGLVLRSAELRLAGLVVLALATIKVFLVDLSSLDVAYRVITLIVLGLVLVASAYAWSHMKPGGPADPKDGHRPSTGTPKDVHARP